MGFYFSTLDRIKAINGAYAVDTKKQAQLNEIQLQIALHFRDTPDYHSETLVNGKTQELLVSRNNKDDSKKTIIAYPGQTFMPGDVVDCFHAKWLITSVDPNQESICKGVMTRCNRELRWQNLNTGEIITRWCTAEKPYYSNSAFNKLADVSTREFKIQIPYDEETCLIDLDRRFMLEVIGERPKTYKVVSVDTVTERFELGGQLVGFLVWNLKQDQYDDKKDNKELQLCDYFEPIEVDDAPAQNDHDIDIMFAGSSSLKIGGSWKRFEAIAYNENGETFVPSGAWEVVVSPQHEGKVESVVNNNILELRASADSSLEGASVKIEFAEGETEKSAVLSLVVEEAI